LERGDTVVGIDIINHYYDVNLKYARLAETGISRQDIDSAEHHPDRQLTDSSVDNLLVQNSKYPPLVRDCIAFRNKQPIYYNLL